MASTEQIKELRGRTSAGVLDCRKALDACGDDIEKAIDWLRTKGLASAAKKASRIASEGLVGSYIHAGGKIGVLVEINCETDFVARTDSFKALVKDIGMQIAAHSPEFVDVGDIPADAIERETQVQLARVMEEGKPRAVAEKIVEGRIKKWYQEVCLLEQSYFRDESKTIRDVIGEAVGSIGENIKVRRFVKFTMGEGLEKRTNDLAAEVAAQLGQG